MDVRRPTRQYANKATASLRGFAFAVQPSCLLVHRNGAVVLYVLRELDGALHSSDITGAPAPGLPRAVSSLALPQLDRQGHTFPHVQVVSSWIYGLSLSMSVAGFGLVSERERTV